MKPRIAIVGAGLAGATTAALLSQAGFQVTVFEKSRGPGGRMATRRVPRSGILESPDGAYTGPPLAFDHGVPCWTAESAEFQAFLKTAEARGLVAPWTPRPHPGSSQRARTHWVGTPDMPALGRWLLTGLKVHTELRIEALERTVAGWLLQDDRGTAHGPFDSALLAVPAPQAAPLWAAHEPRWVETAEAQSLSPCWTLMAVTAIAPSASPCEDDAWDLWQGHAPSTHPSSTNAPTSPPLALVVRQDAKPGRRAQPGQQHWVAHTTSAWAQMHVEADAADVLPRLQAALLALMDQPNAHWHHAVVHRWRYAQSNSANPVGLGFQWNPETGLGGCADWLGGGGVEGAWRSGRSLAEAILDA